MKAARSISILAVVAMIPSLAIIDEAAGHRVLRGMEMLLDDERYALRNMP